MTININEVPTSIPTVSGDDLVAQVEAARDGAETARDAAFVNANAYATVAAGLAATPEGQQFQVVSGDEIIRYRHNAGPVASEVARYPAASRVAPLISIAPVGYEFAVLDGNGLAAFGVTTDGTFRVAKLLADEAAATNLSLGDDASIGETPQGSVFAIVDQYGNASFSISDAGVVSAPSGSFETFNGLKAKRITDLAGSMPGSYTAEINQVISYGQSLSVGVGASSADLQTVSQDYDSLMFNAGVRAYAGGGTDAANHASLVPLIESAVAGPFGETPVGQSAAMIKKLIAEENGIVYTAQSYQLLGSACGVSATAISGLGRGTTGYTRLISDVTYGASLASAAGKTHKVQAVYWSQGEQDYGNGTTYAAYLSAIETLYQHLNTDIKAITGQSSDIKMIAYQCFLTGSSPATVALAQLQASKNNPNIIIACPNYFIKHISGDVHLTGAGYGQLGAYYGLAYKRAIVDEKTWKPLMPVSVERQGAIATVSFAVPVRPLVFDTVEFPSVANSGFSLVDSVGAAVTISSVSITGPNTVKIVAASPLTAGSKVRYGFSGGGNLRDSQGDTLAVQQRAKKAMHNWCVAFEEILA